MVKLFQKQMLVTYSPEIFELKNEVQIKNSKL